MLLRKFQESDMIQMLEILTSNVVNRTYMLPDFAEKADAIPLFERLMGLSMDESRYVRCVSLDGICIGFINDVQIKNGQIELGYVIHPNYHNKGYMTRALKLAIREVFELGYAEVVCGAFSENPASIRVMEKCGMKLWEFTEIIPYRGKDHICVYYKASKENMIC